MVLWVPGSGASADQGGGGGLCAWVFGARGCQMCGITAKASTGETSSRYCLSKLPLKSWGGLSLERRPAVPSAPITPKHRRSQELCILRGRLPRPPTFLFCPVTKRSCERGG